MIGKLKGKPCNTGTRKRLKARLKSEKAQGIITSTQYSKAMKSLMSGKWRGFKNAVK